MVYGPLPGANLQSVQAKYTESKFIFASCFGIL